MPFGRRRLLWSGPHFPDVLIGEQSKHAGPWETGQWVGFPAVYSTPLRGPATALKQRHGYSISLLKSYVSHYAAGDSGVSFSLYFCNFKDVPIALIGD